MLSCLLLGGCADSVGEGVQEYVVRPQDTLYSIAWRHDIDFRDLARWNGIGADFRISVGQVLALGPRAELSRPAGNVVHPPTTTTAKATAKATAAATAAVAPKSAPPAIGLIPKWVWPTDRIGVPVAVAGGGILLSGVLGQDIRSASGGRVVYIGSALRGYGNLIIIKHGETLLSAYAHNREMLVREGQDVAAGQVIAHMGEGPHQAPTLYFEIRQNGKPVDPLPFLTIQK